MEAQPSLSAFLPSSRKASVAPGGGGVGTGEREAQRENRSVVVAGPTVRTQAFALGGSRLEM